VTEILYALGLQQNVIAVTTFCDYPPQIQQKPKIGGMSNPSIESIVLLKPDLVVMTTDGNPKAIEERLRSLNIKTHVFTSRRMDELPQGIREIGAVLGARERAGRLASEIETDLLRVKNEVRITMTGVRKKTALFVVWPDPFIVAGPGTVIDDALQLLGIENAAAGAVTSYPKYSLEEVMKRAPDVIFIGKGHVNMKALSQGLLKRLSALDAVKQGNVFFTSDSLYRLGPRIPSGIEELASHLKLFRP
jgi:iron complex transport system substrate-binding protein